MAIIKKREPGNKTKFTVNDLEQDLKIKSVANKFLNPKGRPKVAESSKKKNKVVLYFSDEELRKIIKCAELDGFDAKNKNKWIKKAIEKEIRRQLI
ncbi:MAG TPA: hypothetical protein EYG80_04500 [Flavobacteriaceae bacterium]|nr:hypothetical protein [Flavobacteriaceae bacterium]